MRHWTLTCVQPSFSLLIAKTPVMKSSATLMGSHTWLSAVTTAAAAAAQQWQLKC
jgi:hypothetical protein